MIKSYDLLDSLQLIRNYFNTNCLAP